MKPKTKKPNWRILLKKYMDCVITSEGASLIQGGFWLHQITEEEKKLLEVIEQEIEDEQ